MANYNWTNYPSSTATTGSGGSSGLVGSVNLTNQVVGILPSGNGGTGTSASWTQGSVIFADGSSSFAQDNANFFWSDSNNRLGIGTNLPSTSLSFGGEESRTISVERTGSGSASAFTIEAGGAGAGALDGNGGNLVLASGKSTGVGTSFIRFQTYTSATTSGSSDNSLTTKMSLTAIGNLGIGANNPTALLQLNTGNRSAAASNNALTLEVNGYTFTDNTSSGSAVGQFNNLRVGQPTIATTNIITTTTVANLRMIGVPIAGANSTITNSIGYFFQGASSAGAGSTTNSYGLWVNAGTGASNNYSATFAGNVGFNSVTDPVGSVEIGNLSRTVGSSEQLVLRSQRANIVVGELVSGIAFKSNDSTNAAPGINVCLIDAISESTHNATNLGTGIGFFTMSSLSMTEAMRISGAGFVGVGTTTPQVAVDIRGQMRIQGSTSGYFGFRAHDVAGSTTYTWPVGGGVSGQFLTTNGTGSLTWSSASFAGITGSVNLTNQVVGNLPLSQTSGSISLVNQVFGTLPLSQTDGIRSQITIGSTTINNTGGATVTWTLPTAQGAASTVLTNNGAGVLSWAAAGTAGSSNAGQYNVVITSNTYVSAINDFVNISVASVTLQATVFLPTATGNTGKQVAVKRMDNYPFTRLVISGTASQTIGMVGSFTVLNQNQSYIFASDGASWRVVANDRPTVRKTFENFFRAANGSTAVRRPYLTGTASFTINGIVYNNSSSASSFGSTTAFLTRTSDPTNGTFMTINESGIYTLNFILNTNSGADSMGWVRNIADGSISITSQSVSAVLTVQVSPVAAFMFGSPWTGILNAGDVISPLQDGTTVGSNPSLQRIYVEKLSDL